MSWKIYTANNYAYFTNTITGEEHSYPKKDIYFRESANAIDIVFKFDRATMVVMQKADIVDADLLPFISNADLIDWLEKNTGSDMEFTDGAVDVILQDSTSNLLIVPVSNITITTTLAVPLNRDSYTMTVTDASAFTTEDIITVYNADANRVFFTHPITVVGNIITCTMPSDFNFPTGSPVTLGSDNMNVDGSVTPQIFGVRNPTADDIPLEFDISRIIIKILTVGTVDLSKFGDIAGGLTRGVLVRRVDGIWQNLFHFDSNGELKNLCYDVEIQLAAGNQQDGLTARFSFAGQDKLGAVVRIRQGEDMQVVIQDDLTSLVRFRMYAEGSVVRNQ